MNCSTCSFAGWLQSPKECAELAYREKGIKYDEAGKVTRVTYPFLEDQLEALSDNRFQAISTVEFIEKRLTKKGIKETFNKEFFKFV